MSLIIIEGNRKAGKSFLINSQHWFPVFKFDFNGLYNTLKLPQNGGRTHHIGYGKELMIHQLHRDGFISDIIMDRGVITNSVWGILNNRVTKKSVYSELDYMIDSGLFKNCFFFLIKGVSTGIREKDNWDFMDLQIPHEIELFEEFYEFLYKKGVKIQIINNNFDQESLSNFQSIIKNLK